MILLLPGGRHRGDRSGASGTLAVLHLLREAAARRVPLRVALIDRHGRHGLGQAYSTTHLAHLLNSPADAMGALAGDPGHLTRWAARSGLRGRWYETTAIPEIRDQAAALARLLVTTQALAGSGTAA
jgi:uncharacterized NAD(P)/FAD-binding protein YdhS